MFFLPDGKPGFNVDLILMDLEKLRASATFKSYFSEIKLNKLIKNYFYHSTDEVGLIRIRLWKKGGN